MLRSNGLVVYHCGARITESHRENLESPRMTLTLDLDEKQTAQLQEAARKLNISVHDLAKAAINDLLAKPDQDFERAADRVLKKNAELYKRLA